MAGVKIPLQTFNAWIQTPIKISMAIAGSKRLQTQLADQQQRAAVHRVQIRQLREEVQRGTRRRFIRPRSSHPDHDIILILDGQPAARFGSLPKTTTARQRFVRRLKAQGGPTAAGLARGGSTRRGSAGRLRAGSTDLRRSRPKLDHPLSQKLSKKCPSTFLAKLPIVCKWLIVNRAGNRNRTGDLLITSQLLCGISEPPPPRWNVEQLRE
jgi:hypothetical protein